MLWWLTLSGCGWLFGPSYDGNYNALYVATEPGEALIPDEHDMPPQMQCDNPNADPVCFIWVEGGTVTMGAQATDPAAPGHDPDALPNESPVRQAPVEGFWMLRDEVRLVSWMGCIAHGDCEGDAEARPDETREFDPSWSLPARRMTWSEANQFCAHLGARLPTEAEWSLAARGTEGRRWSWGDEPMCGYAETSGEGISLKKDHCMLTEPLQARALWDGRTPEGIQGLSGSVWEWVQDVYVEGGGPGAPQPADPPADAPRVQRGSSFFEDDPIALRAASRVGVAPDTHLPDVGFRCVRGH